MNAPIDPYYDPYDFEIDNDPYPVWRRLRDEAPLYENERYGFYALTRFDDVERGMLDWQTFSSAHGTILEMVKAKVQMPPGMVIFEDPPGHDLHRGLLSRVFTPRRMAAIEPEVRKFCAESLDHYIGAGGFDVVKDLGAKVPMKTIGMLLGIPPEDQDAIREQTDEGLKLKSSDMPSREDLERINANAMQGGFADYVEWRSKNPSDDLMTDLLTAEYEDEDGITKTLSREQVLGYIRLIASAGNETTNRLIGFTAKVLAENPAQRAEVVADRSLIPNTIEEMLRFEAPSPIQARYVTTNVELHGKLVPEGSVMLLVNGSANRDERKFENPDQFNVHRRIDRHLSFGFGAHFCLGAALARLEARVALDELLSRFPTWEVDLVNAVQGHTSTVRGWESMPIITTN